MDLPPRSELFDFHGVSLTESFTSNWDNIQKFQTRPDDILIATYPKAGRLYNGESFVADKMIKTQVIWFSYVTFY